MRHKSRNAQIYRRFLNGIPKTTISKEFGLTPTAISAILEKTARYLSHPARQDWTIEEACEHLERQERVGAPRAIRAQKDLIKLEDRVLDQIKNNERYIASLKRSMEKALSKQTELQAQLQKVQIELVRFSEEWSE